MLILVPYKNFLPILYLVLFSRYLWLQTPYINLFILPVTLPAQIGLLLFINIYHNLSKE